MTSFQTNTWGGGMNADIDVQYLKENQYRDALNVRLVTNSDGTSGALTNIDRNINKQYLYNSANLYFNGSIVIRNYVVTFATDIHGIVTITRWDTDNSDDVDTWLKRVILKARNLIQQNSNLSIVGNEESPSIIKLYFTDGRSSIKLLDILNDKYTQPQYVDADGVLLNNQAIDILPSCNLTRPDVEQQIGGTLTAGLVYYAYQLFNKNGSQTTISPLSEGQPIFDKDNSVGYNPNTMQGSAADDQCNKRCSITVKNLTDSTFEYIRLFKVSYTDNNKPPTVAIVTENELFNNESITMVDSGQVSVVVSLSDFQAFYKQLFIATTLEKMNNRLFASNITDDTFDVDYDARAYSINKDYQLHLQDGNSANTVNVKLPESKADRDIVYKSINEWHDCINPSLCVQYNTKLYEDGYWYRTHTDRHSGIVRGGEGLNVSYTLSNTSFLERSTANATFQFYPINHMLNSGVAQLGTPDGQQQAVPYIDLPNYFDVLHMEGIDLFKGELVLDQTKEYDIFVNGVYVPTIREGDLLESYDLPMTYHFADGSTQTHVFKAKQPDTFNIELTSVKGIVKVTFEMPNSYFPGSHYTFYNFTIEETKQPLNRVRIDTGYLPIGSNGYVTNHTQYLGDDMFPRTIPIKYDETTPLSHSEQSEQFKGYQRDEVYRFGVVFYNDKSIASPVHWIADVRMPCGYGYTPYNTVEVEHGHTTYSNVMGVVFSFRNLPKAVKQLEVVRCKRTLKDKTVVDVAATSNLYYANVGIDGEFKKELVSPNAIRPYSFVTNSLQQLMLQSYGGGKNRPVILANTNYRDYMQFISPLISILGDKAEKLYEDCSVIPMYVQCVHPSFDGEANMFNCAKLTKDISGSVNYTIAKDMINPGTFKLENGTINVRMPYMQDTSDYSGGDDRGYRAIMQSMFKCVPYSILNESVSNCKIEDVRYPQMLKFNDVLSLEDKYIPIGGKQYINFAVSGNDGGKSMEHGYTFGPAGHGLIVKLNKAFNTQDFTRHSAINTPGYTTVCYIKRNTQPYDGQSYVARTNSEYITCCGAVPVTDTQETISSTFGGDTYLNVFEHAQQTVFSLPVDTDNALGKSFIGAYIPLESTINCGMLYGDTFNKVLSSDGTRADVFQQLFPSVMGAYHVQELKYYEFNDAYIAQLTAKLYVPKNRYNISKEYKSNRVVVSQAKVSGEIFDSWTTFLHANYIDVDTARGDITNLKAFNGKLLFWLNTAVGVLSVNERALIQDSMGAELTLGTGTILGRYDYINTSFGSSVLNDRSMVETSGRLYWFDSNTREICKYGDTFETLSKAKGVQSLLNAKDQYGRYKYDHVVASLYNRKYNEVWFSFLLYNLIYNEQMDLFIGRASETFLDYFTVSGTPYSVSADYFVKYNSKGSDGTYTPTQSDITYYVNKDYMMPKVFDNVNTASQFSTGIFDMLLDITFETDNLVANPMEPVNYGNTTLPKYAIDYRENLLRFAIGRNKNTNNNNDRLRGNAMKCTWKIDTSNGDFRIPFINTNYRYTSV